MKAATIHEFGPPSGIGIEELPKPTPGPGEVLVRVGAAGVGPWDALIRAHESVVNVPLPIILGSDLSGVVEAVGPGVSQVWAGEEVYGVTNPEFIGAYSEYAIARAGMIARKPRNLSHVEAASVPVVAVTAWQMLFDYAQVRPGQRVLVQGGAGNVGTYAVQLASHAGLKVYATASREEARYVRSLGATSVIDYKSTRFEDVLSPVDVVLDTVGGNTRKRSFAVLKTGGILVSAVTGPMPSDPRANDVRAVFFLVEVTTERLDRISDLVNHGKLRPRVGTVLPLAKARTAHEMLAGAPHEHGKIVLRVAA
jgi:NADPH:quinone reductase-like Zn-dependent oxidoreductase